MLRCFAVSCIVLLLIPVSAGSTDAELIGAFPAEVIGSFGAPDSVFSEPAAADTGHFVVFLYGDYRSFYFYRNELWQIRVDERSAHSLLGVSIGDSFEDVAFEMGPPEWNGESGESASFRLRNHDYPLELRVFVDSDGLIYDLYLYRTDF